MALAFFVLAAGAVAATSTGQGELFSVASLVAFFTLALMEVVLGIDNVVFVAIIVDKLPKEQQALGRNLGLGLALVLRLGLLFGITWIMGLTNPIIEFPDFIKGKMGIALDDPGLSGKDLILIAGGLFLIYKATKEIFEKLEGEHHVVGQTGKAKLTMGSAIIQIILLDLVFSLDSVITAVGMVKHIEIMIAAMLVAVASMIAVAGSIQTFVNKHPSVKILALSFLNLIGVMLLAEGFHQHVNKGYIYSAMGFSLLVELLNMQFRKKHQPVVLNEPKPESLQQ